MHVIVIRAEVFDHAKCNSSKIVNFFYLCHITARTVFLEYASPLGSSSRYSEQMCKSVICFLLSISIFRIYAHDPKQLFMIKYCSLGAIYIRS